MLRETDNLRLVLCIASKIPISVSDQKGSSLNTRAYKVTPKAHMSAALPEYDFISAIYGHIEYRTYGHSILELGTSKYLQSFSKYRHHY
jgi:hypothetical protein